MMENKLFKKLNFKDQSEILVLNHPESFAQELHAINPITIIVTDVENLAGNSVEFAMAFGTTLDHVNTLTRTIAPKLGPDAVFWFCYPKKSSKKYQCEFNRDTGWEVMAEFKLEPVRQVAIDEDWSALRFRHVDNIKTITRRKSFALTKEAKARTTHKNQ
jgi:hypothetical protein